MYLGRALIVVEQRTPPDGNDPGYDIRCMEGPLRCSGLVDNIDVLYYNDYLPNCDEALINYCLQKKPQVVLLSLQNMSLRRDGAPTPGGTGKVSHQLGIPIVAFWFDIHSDGVAEIVEYYFQSVTLNIILSANANSHRTLSAGITNFIYAGVTFDERLFNQPDGTRDIPVGFQGSLHWNRPEWIINLSKFGIPVYTTGGWVPYGEYLKFLSRLKIALNFSLLQNLRYMARARIWEAMWCRTFLLEEDNPVTSSYFKPYIDYVPFTDLKDLTDKIKYFLEHDGERDRIRMQGRVTVEKHYNAKAYWENLFERIGIK